MELSRERLVLFTGAGFLGGLAGWAAAEPLAALRNGGIGGCLGGAIGGSIYQIVTYLLPQTAGRGLALALLGAVIGLGIGLVSEIFKRGWLMVVRSQSRNAREGKEYPLVKAKTTIGRAEESDVGLFGDQSVANLHAMVERQKGKFVLARGEGQVRVNHVPVTRWGQLKNGDRVEVEGTLLLFRERVGTKGGRGSGVGG